MRKIILAVVLVMAVFVVSCAPQVSETMEMEDEMMEEASLSNGMYQIVFNDFRVMPASVEILAGDSVEWVNTDNVAYTLVIEQEGVDTYLPPGATFLHRFENKGMFIYASTIPTYGETEDGEVLRGSERDYRELEDRERILEGIVAVN